MSSNAPTVWGSKCGFSAKVEDPDRQAGDEYKFAWSDNYRGPSGNNVSTFGFVESMIWRIDYRCEDRRKSGELRVGIGAIRLVLTISFKKPRSSPPKKRTVQPGDAFEDTLFKPGFEVVKFQNRL
jgi:hypothetical protein